MSNMERDDWRLTIEVELRIAQAIRKIEKVEQDLRDDKIALESLQNELKTIQSLGKRRATESWK